MFNNEGWICPKCGQVFAPWVCKCDRCPIESNIQTGTGTNIHPWPPGPPREQYTGQEAEPITTCDKV
jgi:predicted ATP-dependent serine protease